MNIERMSEWQVFDDGERMRRLNDMRDSLGLDPVELTKDQPGNDAPTIGIEIEMTWRQAFKDMHDRWLEASDSPMDYKNDASSDTYEVFESQYNQNDTRLKLLLKQIEFSIPRVGNDAYWEFSFLPTQNTAVLDAELATLYDASILFEDIPYATHMTIADIPSFRDAATILCRLEQAGGTTQERLEAAINAKRHAWAIKGKGGIRMRNSQELLGRAKIAFELRTLVTTSPEQMSRLLSTAQHLAELSINRDERWKELRKETEEQLADAGLPLAFWADPKRDEAIWRKYGELFLQSY